MLIFSPTTRGSRVNGMGEEKRKEEEERAEDLAQDIHHA